jgi:long-subunit acyl-CoA synthetase (AMP-forming)
MIHLGGAMGLAESPSTIVNDIVQIKPTFLIAVPPSSTGFTTACGLK